MSIQDRIGIRGENAVYNYLIQEGYQVEDVSENPEFWQLDIDFLITKDGCSKSIEVKNDTALGRTGNLYIETI